MEKFESSLEVVYFSSQLTTNFEKFWHILRAGARLVLFQAPCTKLTSLEDNQGSSQGGLGIFPELKTNVKLKFVTI